MTKLKLKYCYVILYIKIHKSTTSKIALQTIAQALHFFQMKNVMFSIIHHLVFMHTQLFSMLIAV